MVILLSFLCLLLSVLYLYERAKRRAVNQELRYIRERLGTEPYRSENGYILIPSENIQVKELAAEMNRLLDTFYSQKAEYERSRQAMVQVLTNISHDLRTPLTVLKGYSELLGRETAKTSGAADIQDMASKIESKADELVETINEYFTISKITSGDMKIDLQRANITEVCHEVILDYYDILEETQYKVEIEIGPSPEYALADTDALKRILKNLIDNAVRHGGDGKYLALRLKREDVHAGQKEDDFSGFCHRQESGRVIIEIEDHGQGIPEKDQEQIFYRNYTTARKEPGSGLSVTAHKGSGSGLGLAIAKDLALRMGADLRVMSEPGVKTVFTLALKV